MPDDKLLEGLKTSFIDRTIDSDETCRAQLLVNEESQGCFVLNAIEEELRACDEFAISVAFVTLSGLTPLLLTLSELEQKGIPGKILTTDYLTFTDPRALQRLREFSNLDVRMFCTSEVSDAAKGFHTKGYIFKTGAEWRFIVGSSNLTGSALKTNREWNVKLIAKEEGAMTQSVREEFESLWNHACTHPVADIIEDYQERFAKQAEVRRNIAEAAAESLVKDSVGSPARSAALKPNLMQQRLIVNLLDFLHTPDEDPAHTDRRALLISATGTGKTYASAFAVQAAGPERVLFLVHREQIARKSCNSYRRVLGETYSYGFLISQDRSALSLTGKYAVFSTMQTMVRNLDERVFAPETFDVIVIDEVHRASAASYKAIMNYFKPKLWLGMTATPDRPDTENIYELFHHQILLDLRLQQALEQDLLCPFHYFGITELINDTLGQGQFADFAKLTSNERVHHILENIKRFGFCGERVKGLVFCSTIAEAKELSAKFNTQGLRTLALSGTDSQDVREAAIARLTTDSYADRLDYLLTVDIFNEGVDIPEVNQVVLLRQTQSPIVFVQQLGRGLRKAPGKEFLVVIDFIGNYANNYMIPVALSGDRSYQKDTMRKTLIANTIPGNSTIHFDQVARERIFKAIDSARTDSMQQLKNAYQLLKYQIGRVPTLLDFERHGSIDATKFFSNKIGSYVEFLYKADKEDHPVVSPIGREMLTYLSAKIGSGQRISEALVLEAIVHQSPGNLKDLLIEALPDYGVTPTDGHLSNCAKVLTNNFARTKDAAKKTPNCVFIVYAPDDDTVPWTPAPAFANLLNTDAQFKEHLADLIAFVKDRYRKRFQDRYRDTAFKLYERYTYDDVCRLLDWENNMPATNIGGYRYDAGTKTLPVLINYDKDEDAIAYHDHFESPQSLIALSKTNRSVGSVDADHIYKRTFVDQDNRIYLFFFFFKDDNETKAFYFLGEVDAQDAPKAILLEEKTPAFEIRYRLETPVRADIYTYLTH